MRKQRLYQIIELRFIMLILCGLLFVSALSPVIICLAVALTALRRGVLITSTRSKWWALVVVVVFLGGIIVMFFYITRVAEPRKLYLRAWPWVALVVFPFFIGGLAPLRPPVPTGGLISWLYARGSEIVVVTLTALLVLLLLLIIKICESCEGSLSKKF